MNQSRIEQTIEEIYAFIEECKSSKLYPNKVVVAKDELYDMLDALRLSTPEEIRRYKKIISNRDAILNEAYAKAEELINSAKTQNAQLIDKSEIVQTAAEYADALMKEANEQAEQMIREANEDAEGIRNASLQYTNELLTDAEKMLQSALDEFKSKYLGIENSVQSVLKIIKKNKSELVSQQKGKKDVPESVTLEVEVVDEVAPTESE